jgi:hypothetical protein
MQKKLLKNKITLPLALIFILGLLPLTVSAQEPKVGRKAAAKYFGKDAEPSREVADKSGYVGGDNLLMLHVGGYSSSTCYRCKGSETRGGAGSASYGVTYLYDQTGGLDVNIRLDFNEYKLDDQRATKLSFMPLWTFPKAETKFPLYFGFGAGVGVFFTQIENESNIAFDYQLVGGARFMDLIENFGAFVEFGLKNNLYILSDGQFNGTALTAGAVFSF